MNKADQIRYGISKIHDILQHIDNNKDWRIYYHASKQIKDEFAKKDIERFHLISGDEYILIYNGSELLYSVNVTGDSALTALEELMLLLSKKF